MKIIITPNGKKLALNANMSANAIAKHPIINNGLGKTSILEMLRGTRKEAKGFKITEIEKPYIANKLGVESVGTGKLRQRKPMEIYIKPLSTRGLSENMQQSDFSDFLTSVYKTAKVNDGMVEYSQLSSILGWSRNMVAVYAARARKLGFVAVERNSNCVWTKGA